MRRGIAIAVAASIGASLALPATSSAGVTFKFFHTADGNINCVVYGGKKAKRKHGKKIPRLPGTARCDVNQHTWVAPPKPRWCDVDWGFGVTVFDRGLGKFVCAGDGVASPQTPVVAEGGVVTSGKYSCSVLAGPAVRCTNGATAHGFEVSAAAVALF